MVYHNNSKENIFMRNKMFFAIFSVLVILAVAVSPVGAVTDGVPDGSGHPFVGLMVADDADGNPMWRCSGTLISPTIFLTAGHCTFGAARATIWFEADVQNNPGLGYPFGGPTSVDGTPYAHPQYDDNAFFLHDLGVVVLDAPVVMSTYGALPALNSLDALKPNRQTTFTAVGYGLQKAFPTATDWKESRQRIRMIANPHLVQINTGFTGDGSLVLSNNANTGGTCFGDSGGPNFVGNSNVVGGVTSFGLNSTCAGTGGVYRVDRADDLNWLATDFGVTP
jgi:V8-like Glu-specific endopeptidase